MKIIVDTSVWSCALRHNADRKMLASLKKEISELINESRIVVLGVILQEILSGIKEPKKGSELKNYFLPFDLEEAKREYYVQAAEFFNQCRKKGVCGSHIDFYICAVASLNDWHIFTFDKDFEKYEQIIPLNLYVPRFFG